MNGLADQVEFSKETNNKLEDEIRLEIQEMTKEKRIIQEIS